MPCTPTQGHKLWQGQSQSGLSSGLGLGQQRASVGQSKANAIVMPIKLCVELADEAGAQDPDRPSGWRDVQTVEGQCTQVIITVGVLAGSKMVSPLPIT